MLIKPRRLAYPRTCPVKSQRHAGITQRAHGRVFGFGIEPGLTQMRVVDYFFKRQYGRRWDLRFIGKGEPFCAGPAAQDLGQNGIKRSDIDGA